MPLMTSLTQNYVVDTKPTDFLDEEIHKNAQKDFCYLITKSKLGYSLSLKHVVIIGSTSEYIADVAVLGASVKDSMVTFSKDSIHREDNAYIGLVLYDENEVVCVYMH